MDVKLLSAGDDIKIWDSSDFTLARQLNPHDQNVSSVCWADDNSYLASASVHAEDIAVTNMSNFESMRLHTGPGCMCIDVNDTSRYLLNGSSDGLISVWDLKSHKISKTYKGHKGPVTCARFNQGSSAIASGSETGEIIIYNVVTGQGCRPLLAPNVQAIKQIQFSRYKKSLFGSVSDDGCVNLWDANTRQLIHSFTCHRAPTTGLSFSPINDIFLMSVGLDKRIACHDVQTKKVVKIMTAESPLTSIDTKSDGVTVAVGSTRGKIYHYDLRMGLMPVRTLDAHKSSVQCLRFQAEQKVEPSSNKSTSVAAKQQLKNKGRQLPTMPKENIENTAPMPETGIGEDVFSPLREGYQDQSSEEMDYRSNGSLLNSNQNARNSAGDSYSGGVFSPINEAIGRGSGSGVGLSPLTYSGYPLSEQNRNSPGILDYNRMNSQNNIPSLKVTHPSVEEKYDSSRVYNKMSSHSVSDHTTNETSPREHLHLSDSHSSNENISSSQKHVAFETDQEKYSFLAQSGSSTANGVQSPELKRQRQAHNHQVGMSASPQFSSMPLDDSPGSAHGSARTPDGVNAQSSVPNNIDYQHSGRKEDRIVKNDGKTNSRMLSGDMGQLAEIIRSVVQEELSDFKKDMRCVMRDEVDDMVDQLHRDIINLQAEMLIQFQIHQTEMLHLLERYSVNQDLVCEVQRLQEEVKRLKKNF
ncbi:protein NEDD1-like [Mercenaria mercenaria]|uniref:protein NEDD1-like n=1 Tax=Mercenaria mercenaria TaxID=6596 RepID=UPI00234F7E77|nr:protein NEDD1-like [Mercenaria mercenaria]